MQCVQKIKGSKYLIWIGSYIANGEGLLEIMVLIFVTEFSVH